MLSLEEKREKHINKYMHNYDIINTLDLRTLFPSTSYFVFDTESSYLNENLDENGDKLPEKIIVNNKKIWNPDFDFEVHVYAWAIGNTANDHVLYGNNLDDMFTAFSLIIKSGLPKTLPKKKHEREEFTNIKCFAHNLAWDIEFCKYTLHNKGYEYHRSDVNEVTLKKKKSTMNPMSYSITENDNIVYGAKVAMEQIKHKNSKITPTIDFVDSYKIMSMKLDTIGKKVISIDDMFLKMGADYDYEKVRTKGHELTQFEKEYLYNDIYILKEFLVQFYLPLNTEQMTASSISFEKFIKTTFNEDEMSSAYEKFEAMFPDLSSNAMTYNIIRKSYKGGWTQANRRYLGTKQLLRNAVSIDINSSYPATIRYKPLPYGIPKLITDTSYNYKDTDYNMAILTIEFDGFRNKNEDNLIGEFQVGALNTEVFDMRGTEYIHTNIIDGEFKGSNGESVKHRYKMSIWDFELENMLENMELLIEEKVYSETLECYYGTGESKVGYEIESILAFKNKTGFFADVVDELTEMKIKGKIEGNAPMTNFAKLCLNSFYGKLASRYEREERLLYFDENGMAQYTSDGLCYESDRRYYPAFASAVTAWSRVNLRTNLYNIGYNNVLYFDTDSLYTTLPADEVKKVVPNLDPNILGYWDIEKEYDEFKAIGAKKYILHGRDYGSDKDMKIICKCAGLPEEVRKEQTFESFYLGNTFYGKKVKTKVLGGYVLIEGEYKLSDNWRN